MFWKKNLKVGDIILARRYQNEEEKAELGKNHQISPHIIIKKTLFKIYALQCTSNAHQNLNNPYAYFFLGKLKYNLNKNCYIKTFESYEIIRYQYLKTIAHLTNNDFNKLLKNVFIVSKQKNAKLAKKVLTHLKYVFDVGDLIEYQNQKYYIYQTDKKYLYLTLINKKAKSKNKIVINNTLYGFNFAKKSKIKKNKKIKLINTFDLREIMLINKYEEEYLNRLKARISPATVGCLIKYQDQYYYVFEEKDNCYNVIILYNSSFKKQMKKIVIEGGIYYTLFEKQFLKKDLELAVKRKANGKEIASNLYLISNKHYLNIPNDNLFLEPRMIVTNTINKQNYLILNKENNIVDLININNLSDNYQFLIEENNCPLKYFKSIDELEFNEYLQKINELEQLAKDFC